MNLAADDLPTNGWSALCYLAGLAVTAFFLWLVFRRDRAPAPIRPRHEPRRSPLT